jgi:Ulp1 family protease
LRFKIINKKKFSLLLKALFELYNLEDDPNNWSHNQNKDIPLQNNYIDCGVFCLIYAEHIAQNKMMDFSAYHIPHYRYKIAADLLEGKYF